MRFFNMGKTAVVAGLLVAGSTQLSASSLPDEPWGKDSVAGGCVVCHSLEKNGPFRSAPNLWGIVGSPKASRPGFGYSISLKKKGGDWTEEELDRFFSGPSAYAPGTKKTMISMKDPAKRQELIDFLKTLKD